MLVASTLISKEQIQQVLTIRRGIALAARYTPWDSSCLTQALIAKFWCQRYQILYLFFIGLAKESNQPLRRLFATRTSYDALDIRIEMTREKKKALLLVMAHTFLPLHNNGSELSS